MGLRVLVCGGRDFDHESIVWDILSGWKDRHIKRDRPWTTIISGGARGVDTHAESWAYGEELSRDIYPAEWKKYGKSAGYIRNRRMLEEGNPDLVIAFPGGRGTAMMVELAEEAGVEVVDYND